LDRLARFVKTDRENRESLTAELEQLHRAVDRLPDGLVVLDRYDHVQWCNDAAQELHGIVGTGRPLHHFIRQPEFIGYLDGDDYSRPPVLPLATRPGRLFELRLHRSDEHHKLLISRDLTEQARLDAMRRDFVANVSHEIRTPVTVIGGFAETLLDLELDPSSQREYLSTILKQSRTMQRLVEDLLTLATLESSSAPPESERIDVHAMIRAVGAEAQALSQGRHAISYRLDGPPLVLASPIELESAIRNLAINAVRYTPDQGRIEIGWRIVDNEGRLSVRDSGIGIAQEHLPRLTERFYRVDRGRSRDSGGTGLGLAIVKHIAQHHGGQLRIESSLGQGSLFTLVLPVARLIAESSSDSAPDRLTAPASGG
ncbi:MAG: phosphate regulon sensor histidine kinase PhoR, partial [Burkholderiaceae bacterium]|nr:phosphate regulon sensor histidine kinase PhoR [Burkholderiaceae bacterium]